MGKGGRYGKYGENKRKRKLDKQKSKPLSGRDRFKFAEHFKISPKHPGEGRK